MTTAERLIAQARRLYAGRQLGSRSLLDKDKAARFGKAGYELVRGEIFSGAAGRSLRKFFEKGAQSS
jgi:hypothetical protein